MPEVVRISIKTAAPKIGRTHREDSLNCPVKINVRVLLEPKEKFHKLRHRLLRKCNIRHPFLGPRPLRRGGWWSRGFGNVKCCKEGEGGVLREVAENQ